MNLKHELADRLSNLPSENREEIVEQIDLYTTLLANAIITRHSLPEPVVMAEDIERRKSGFSALPELEASKKSISAKPDISASRSTLSKRLRFTRFYAKKAIEMRNDGMSFKKIADCLRIDISAKYLRQLILDYMNSTHLKGE